jgi:hypothetical protein
MKTGTHVRLSDGRTGFVCGSTIDGLTVHLDEGRIAHALAKDVTVIPAPVATDPPPPQRTVQPIQTHHAEPPAEVREYVTVTIPGSKWMN